MMDIVKRLRSHLITKSELDHAALEIERLRNAVQSYLDAYDNATGTVYVEPIMRKVMPK